MSNSACLSRILCDGFQVLLRLLRTPYSLLRRLKLEAPTSFCLTALPTQEVRQWNGRTITANSPGAVNLEGYGKLLSELRAGAAAPDVDYLKAAAAQWRHTGHFDLESYARMFADSVPAGATFAHVCVAQGQDEAAILLVSNAPR